MKRAAIAAAGDSNMKERNCGNRCAMQKSVRKKPGSSAPCCAVCRGPGAAMSRSTPPRSRSMMASSKAPRTHTAPSRW